MKGKVEAGPHPAALAEPAGNHHAVSALPHHHLRPAPHPVCGGHGPWATVVASRAEAREIDAVRDRRAGRFELPIARHLVIGGSGDPERLAPARNPRPGRFPLIHEPPPPPPSPTRPPPANPPALACPAPT